MTVVECTTYRACPTTTHKRSGRFRGSVLALACMVGSAGYNCAPAAPPIPPMPDAEALQSGPMTAGPLNFLTGVSRSSYLLGDMWGLRSALSRYGISLVIQETSEVLGNVSGGVRRGAAYDGLTQAVLQLDTKRAFGWYGGLFNISALQIHGRNLSADNLLNLQTASGIEANRATRLWELWYQQKFLEEDRLDVRVGQQSLDQEFMVSQNASYFINTMFGWPMVPSADLPGGGPAYPLSAPGARFRARPIDSLAVLVGVFNGSPVRYNYGDPQQRNPSGTSFPLNGGVLAIAELQYAYPSPGAMLYPDQAPPLGRLYKLGAWFDSESFDDQLLDNMGLSLANPASGGVARAHRGNFGIYAVVDQMLWADQQEANRTINFFARAMGTPQSNRNLIDVSVNVGLTFHEPVSHRDADTFAIGMGWAKVSHSAGVLDRDTGFYSASFQPMRTNETFLEITYQYQLIPSVQLQPDIQYIFNPGGGVLTPNGNGAKIKNELVLGVRTNILF